MSDTFQKSTRINKKYMVQYNGKYIHFGDTRYDQYEDKALGKTKIRTIVTKKDVTHILNGQKVSKIKMEI